MSKGIVLHHLEASRSIRVVWLLECLDVPYELKVYPRDQKTRLATNEPYSGKGLAAIHPTGRAPLLQDDGLILAESGNIIRHLLEHHNSKGLYPKSSEKTQASIDQSFWIDFAEASIMLHLIPLNTIFKVQAVTEDGTSAQEKAIARGIMNDMKYVEMSLEKNGGTLAGTKELGPADFVNIFGIEFYALIISLRSSKWRDNLNLHLGSATEKWLQRCHADEKYKKACSLERNGKYTPNTYINFLVGKE